MWMCAVVKSQSDIVHYGRLYCSRKKELARCKEDGFHWPTLAEVQPLNTKTARKTRRARPSQSPNPSTPHHWHIASSIQHPASSLKSRDPCGGSRKSWKLATHLPVHQRRSTRVISCREEVCAHKMSKSVKHLCAEPPLIQTAICETLKT